MAGLGQLAAVDFPLCLGCGPKPGEVLFIPFKWLNVAAGDYAVTVRAVSLGGKKLESAPVKIRVLAAEVTPWMVRGLPDTYQPGESFDVRLTAKPPAGTQAHSVMDSPPSGWDVPKFPGAGFGTLRSGW